MRSKFSLFSLLFSLQVFAVCDQLELDLGLQAKGFKHGANSALTWFNSHHSASDVVTGMGLSATLRAKFSYGPFSKDLEDEEIELWIDTCSDKLLLLGSFTTDSDGRIHVEFPTHLLPQNGRFKVWARVTGDNSHTAFMLSIFEPGTKLAVFDIDGTLTYSNLNSDFRKGASEITHRQTQSGLEIIYLSGRHYLLTNHARGLLLENECAKGSLIVGESWLNILPMDGSVGEFKAEYLEYLKSLGLELERAYGNEETDIYAYKKAGIPESRIFIVGEAGGRQGTVALGDGFLEHISQALALN